MPAITVVICTFNPDARLLRRAIESILPQLAPNDAELVVVDNNSSPSLAKRGDLTAFRSEIRLVEEPRPGLTAAREAAYAAARGEILVFVDDDNALSATYLQTSIELLGRYPDVGVLGGSVVAEYESAPPAWFGPYEPWIAVRPLHAEALTFTDAPPVSEGFPIGAGIVVRAALAREHVADSLATSRVEGRKGASLSSGEDLDLGLFALSKGLRLLVSGQLEVRHSIPASRLAPEYLVRLAVSNVRSAAELDRKWTRRLGTRVFPMFDEPALTLRLKRALFAASPKNRPSSQIRAAALDAILDHRPNVLETD